MILHAYGCSWTIGQGADVDIENTLTETAKFKFQKENSWVKFLSDKLNIENINHGVSGNSNNKIFNKLIDDLKNNIVKKDDFVIIMWSSSLRDYVPFLPNGEWVTWSTNHLIKEPHKFINAHNTQNKEYDSFFKEYKEFFLTELFNQNYYNIVNQNYIIFLQKILKYYGIKYVMCDAFEPMMYNLSKKDDVLSKIDKSYYWQFNKQTFRDFLIKTNRLDIWEYQDVTFKTRATQHPNKEGYKLISQELYNYIVKNNII